MCINFDNIVPQNFLEKPFIQCVGLWNTGADDAADGWVRGKVGGGFEVGLGNWWQTGFHRDPPGSGCNTNAACDPDPQRQAWKVECHPGLCAVSCFWASNWWGSFVYMSMCVYACVCAMECVKAMILIAKHYLISHLTHIHTITSLDICTQVTHMPQQTHTHTHIQTYTPTHMHSPPLWLFVFIFQPCFLLNLHSYQSLYCFCSIVLGKVICHDLCGHMNSFSSLDVLSRQCVLLWEHSYSWGRLYFCSHSFSLWKQ